MKNVPFYANHEDNLHCAIAVYRMMIEYFTGRKLSWEEADKLAGFKPGKAAWTVTIWTRLANQGFDIKMIEPFDYRRYEEEGISYLRSLYTEKELAWVLEKSNIGELGSYIDDFLAKIKPECRAASLQDIDEMLDEGRLVFLELDSRVLNNKEGYSRHAIMIFGKDGESYVVHDPGPSPHPNRTITAKSLIAAMGGEQHCYEVTGVKYGRMPSIRLDQYVVREHPALSRSFAVKLINEGRVLVNSEQQKPGYKIKAKDIVTIDFDDAELDVIPKIDLPILHEDDDVIVIDKPSGVISHARGKYWDEASVASFIRNKTLQESDEDQSIRTGIVHRLDRATSGVMICAKNQAALSFLQKQFDARTVQKTYVAVIAGHLKTKEALIDMPIERNPKAPATFRVGANGKPSRTRYKVLAENERYSLVELKPETGRTHQLRVHLKQLGHPIVGDQLYDGEPAERLMLHARSLDIMLPNDERKTFEAPLPKLFNEYTA